MLFLAASDGNERRKVTKIFDRIGAHVCRDRETQRTRSRKRENVAQTLDRLHRRFAVSFFVLWYALFALPASV